MLLRVARVCRPTVFICRMRFLSTGAYSVKIGKSKSVFLCVKQISPSCAFSAKSVPESVLRVERVCDLNFKEANVLGLDVVKLCSRPCRALWENLS